LTAVLILLIATGIIMAQFDIYYTYITVVIAAALLMGAVIMKSSSDLTYIECGLSDDAKSVTISNRGNAPAYDIHVALVPLETEFDIEKLGPDEEYTYPLDTMLREGKAAVTYRTENGAQVSRTFRLAGIDGGEKDLLKPVFPMFGWK
ncbi:MAG: hypothetical protein ACXQTN_05265, partial [Methanoculleaceae archaeon]